MKKIKKKLPVFVVLITMLLNIPVSLRAKEDAGYVYDHVQVDVTINERREYIVKETMDIDFYEALHGIVRTIPKSSSVESYEIKDIHVEGMPFRIMIDKAMPMSSSAYIFVKP